MVVLNMAKVSNNEMTGCADNPCEEKAQSAQNTQFLVFLFYSWLFMMSVRADIPKVVISGTQRWLLDLRCICCSKLLFARGNQSE